LIGLLAAVLPFALIGFQATGRDESASGQLLLAGVICGATLGSVVNWSRLSMRDRDREQAVLPAASSIVALPVALLLLVVIAGFRPSGIQAEPPLLGGSPQPTLASTSASARAACSPSPNPATTGLELLTSPWTLMSSQPEQARECRQAIEPGVLHGRAALRVTYDLHGLIAQGKDASALIIDQGSDDSCVNRTGCRWHYVSLSSYGTNGAERRSDSHHSVVRLPWARLHSTDERDPAHPVLELGHVRGPDQQYQGIVDERREF
jgi:hypothetical protein